MDDFENNKVRRLRGLRPKGAEGLEQLEDRSCFRGSPDGSVVCVHKYGHDGKHSWEKDDD